MDYPFDPAVAEAFLERVWRGGRINDLLDKPGMPSQRAYRHWRRTHTGFQARLAGLRALRYAGGQTHPRWRRLDQALADRMLLRVARGEPWRRMLETDPSMPSRAVVYRWRRERPEWDAALRIAFKAGRRARGQAGTQAVCEQMTEEIGERIALDGASLRSLGAEPGMPSGGTLYRWRALFPAFAREVADAYEFHGWMEADRALAESPYHEQMLREMAGKMR